MNAPARELLLAQTEDYVEYSRHGAVLKGLEKAVARSKYEEDVLINNHTVRTEEKGAHEFYSSFLLLSFLKNNLFSLVYLGFLLERWLLGIQVLSIHGEAELLHRRDWSSDSK